MGQVVMSIRPLEVSDLAEAVDLEARCQPRPWSEGVFKDELSAPNRIYLAAFDDGMVGFGGSLLVGDEAHVTTLLVAPDRRREGVGRSLLVELIQRVVDEGAQHLTLEVRSENEAARSLYRSVGLAPVGVRPGYYGDDDALIMWVHDIARQEYLDGLGGSG
jgi:[ribosomal protein S18]-alanine N-acetyltransferase